MFRPPDIVISGIHGIIRFNEGYHQAFFAGPPGAVAEPVGGAARGSRFAQYRVVSRAVYSW